MTKESSNETELLSRLTAYLTGQNEVTQQAAQPAVMVAAPTLADSIGSSTRQQADVNPQLQTQLNAVMNAAPQASPALEKLNPNTFASNTQGNREAGQNKMAQAADQMQDMRAQVQEIGRKMADGPAAPGQKAAGGHSMAGMAATEIGLTAMGLPGVGLAAAAVAAVAKAVLAPNINVEGQGTFSSQKTASEPVRSGRGRVFEYEMAPAPQVIAGPAATVMNKLNNGPGFGPDMSARALLTGANLNEISLIKLDKAIEQSPAMLQAAANMRDGKDVEGIHRQMEARNLETAGGKASVPEHVQQLVKGPAAPTPAFYT